MEGLPIKPLWSNAASTTSRQQRCRAGGPIPARAVRTLSCWRAPCALPCCARWPLGSRSPPDLSVRFGSPEGPRAGPWFLQPQVAQFAVNMPVPPTRHSTAPPAGPGQGQPLQAFWGSNSHLSTLSLVKRDSSQHRIHIHTHIQSQRKEILLAAVPANPGGTRGVSTEHQPAMLSAGTDGSIRALRKDQSLPLSDNATPHSTALHSPDGAGGRTLTSVS